ncbi:MAG: hypothetical protein ACI9NC_005119, partial [Verrucomicrobiales bacterium]
SPTPNPMTWASIPTAASTTSITMTATTASDISGVEYRFLNLTDSAHDSAWQASPSYIDTGLAPGSAYVYQVSARDLSPAQNTTGASSTIPETTDPDVTAPAPDPMTFASAPSAMNSTTITMTATAASDISGVEYLFQNLTDSAHDSAWQGSATYTDTGLASGTSYTYQVTARDLSAAQNTTAASATAAASTTNPQPVVLFADGFESGDMTTGGWDTFNSSAAAKSSALFTGSWGAELKNSTWIERSVSTFGYDSIGVTFARQTAGLDSGEVLLVEWSTGGAWTEIESTQSTTYSAVAFDLPGAADSPAFKIRFTTNANRNNEKARIDDVQITGIPTAPPTAPGAASAPSPADSSNDVNTVATLTWTAGSGADSHDVYFGTNPAPGAGEFQGNQAGSAFDLGVLAYSTTYHWRIDEVNGVGTTTGAVWSFTTQSPPPPPGQASAPNPSDTAINVSNAATLSWTAGSGADSHDVYFGTNPAPGAGEFQGNQPGSAFDPGVLAYSTTYFWQIDEVNATGTSTGIVWSFTTESAPPAPGQASGPSPADVATNVSTTAGLSWIAGSGASSHDVYFGTIPTPSAQGNQTGTSFDPGPLAPSTTYYWHIDEVNTTGITVGVTWSFTTMASSAPVSLFSDGFESGNYSTGGWITQRGGAAITGGAAFAGSSGAELKKTTWIETSVSTAGHHSVHLKYVRRTVNLDSGKFLHAEWWDGSAWDTVESTQATAWAPQDLALPAAADDNANLKIRFRLASNSNKEKAHIDDVEVTAVPN